MLKSWTHRARAVAFACAIGITAAPAAAAEVVLRWAPVSGAVSYDVQVAHARDFAKLIVSESVATAGYRWTGSPDRNLYWRVRSVDSEGRPSVWSPTRVIHTRLAIPKLEAPAPGMRVTYDRDPLEVDLSFSASPGATQYLVHIATTPAFEQPLTVKSATNQARARLHQTGRLYWRVIALGADGNESGPSEARELQVVVGQPGAVAVPSAPVTWNPSGPTVELGWKHELQLVGRWRVEIAHGKNVARRMTTRRPLAALEVPGPGLYAIRVAGLDTAGQPGRWSKWSNLQVDPPAASAIPTPVEPPPPPPPTDKIPPEPVRAQMEPKTVSLVADGSATAEVAVSFYDADGHIVRDLPLRVSCADGAVELVGSEEGHFRVRYHAPSNVPATGVSDIALALGAFEAHTRVELTHAPRHWRVAAHLGWLTNAGLISSVYVAAAASWRAPWFDDRLAIAARVGYYGMSDTVEGISVTGHFVPFTVAAFYDVLREPVRAYLGFGGGLVIAMVGPSYDINAQAFPIGAASAGAAYPLGPGEIDVAVAGELSLADRRALSGRVSGFLITVGYRYTLPW